MLSSLQTWGSRALGRRHYTWLGNNRPAFTTPRTLVVSLRMRIDEHLRVYKKEVERMAKRKGRSREFIDDSDDPEDTGVSS